MKHTKSQLAAALHVIRVFLIALITWAISGIFHGHTHELFMQYAFITLFFTYPLLLVLAKILKL